jgi:hypothetical protein
MATSSASSSNKQGGLGSKKEGIDDLFQCLGIGDETFANDLFFEEIEGVPKESIKWMALARVHTTNYFSQLYF